MRRAVTENEILTAINAEISKLIKVPAIPDKTKNYTLVCEAGVIKWKEEVQGG